MIIKNMLDKEAYIRAKSIEEIKQNQYLSKDDLVKLPNDINHYLITDEVTEIVLTNGLYAKKIMVSDENLQTSDKTIVGAINELIGQTSEGGSGGNSDTAERLATPRNINGVPFDGTQDITITANPNPHNHVWNDISDKPTSLPNPNNLVIKFNGTGDQTYNGSASLEVNITPASIGAQVAGDYAASSHNHDGVYQPAGDYALNNHNHDLVYSKLGHTHSNAEITDLDASKITSGILDIARIPAAALERLIEVNDDEARFALTKDNAQIGDTVKVTTTLKMYRIVDDNSLNSEAGYVEYSVGRAAEVPWTGVTGKPSAFTPEAHNQSSSTISDLTGYVKSGSFSALAVSDTLNVALGKLEKGLDDKEPVIVKNTGFNLNKSDEIALDDSNTLSTSKAVKIAYDKAVEAYNRVPDLSSYQPITDNSLQTTDKTVPGAINELKTGKLDINAKASSATVADTAGKLTTPVNINGTPFDGSSDITFSVADNTKLPLTGGTINGSLTVTGDILSNGNVTAYSDRRIKENIVPIENSLYKVKQLQGITYNLIGDDKRQAGLIAQDVEEVLPEVVIKNTNEVLSLDYSRIVALLVNAINELSEKVGD